MDDAKTPYERPHGTDAYITQVLRMVYGGSCPDARRICGATDQLTECDRETTHRLFKSMNNATPTAGPIKVAKKSITNDFAAMTPLPRTNSLQLLLNRCLPAGKTLFKTVPEAAFRSPIKAGESPLSPTVRHYTFA
jgi:hypothetical protein